MYLLGEAAAIVDCICHEGFAWAIAVCSWLVCMWPGFSVSGVNVELMSLKEDTTCVAGSY